MSIAQRVGHKFTEGFVFNPLFFQAAAQPSLPPECPATVFFIITGYSVTIFLPRLCAWVCGTDSWLFFWFNYWAVGLHWRLASELSLTESRALEDELHFFPAELTALNWLKHYHICAVIWHDFRGPGARFYLGMCIYFGWDFGILFDFLQGSAFIWTLLRPLGGAFVIWRACASICGLLRKPPAEFIEFHAPKNCDSDSLSQTISISRKPKALKVQKMNDTLLF